MKIEKKKGRYIYTINSPEVFELHGTKLTKTVPSIVRMLIKTHPKLIEEWEKDEDTTIEYINGEYIRVHSKSGFIIGIETEFQREMKKEFWKGNILDVLKKETKDCWVVVSKEPIKFIEDKLR